MLATAWYLQIGLFNHGKLLIYYPSCDKNYFSRVEFGNAGITLFIIFVVTCIVVTTAAGEVADFSCGLRNKILIHKIIWDWKYEQKYEIEVLGLRLIHSRLVKRAGFWVKELALSNIHFIFANASISFKHLVSTYPGPLMLVSILCPDPHFKKRHHKRRVVQKPLVDSILTSLMPGGKRYICMYPHNPRRKATVLGNGAVSCTSVFVQSDVLEVAVDMRKQFDLEPGALQHVDTVDPSVLCDDEGWLMNNPMGIRTEREIHAEFEGAKIYRRLYQKRIH
ncbi:tRNA (guanine-N-7) methyltransferase [Theobroma cacao]|nr:tRNA (guanine-N-7) methyltransferase [Theobroma cacao]